MEGVCNTIVIFNIKEAEIMDRKVVISPVIARKLVQAGCLIVDIMPDRRNSSKSVFVFQVDDKFTKLFKEAMDDEKSRKNSEITYNKV